MPLRPNQRVLLRLSLIPIGCAIWFALSGVEDAWWLASVAFILLVLAAFLSLRRW